MSEEEMKIITLGDIFKNIETEEKAFKFKDYIKELQEKVEKQKRALLDIKEIFDKHTSTNELGTKYLITSTKEDKELIDIVNKALGSDK